MQVTILNYRFSVFQFQFSIVNYQLNKFMAFRKDNKIKSNFSKISIGLASPEEILENSSGEVLKPETINYRIVLRSHLWSYQGLRVPLR